MRLKFGRGRVVRYPTGYKTRRWDLTSPKGRVRIHVEQTLAHGDATIKIDRLGDYVVSGSVVPKGARGVICHESLPTLNFQLNRKAAFARARKWYRHFLPQCE